MMNDIARDKKLSNDKRALRSAGILIFALLLIFWWGLPTYHQLKADAMVKELCAKDGGVKIYETVRLPADRFTEFGEIRVSHQRFADPNDEFYYTADYVWYVPEGKDISELAVYRGHHRLIRSKDAKVLGESVSYSRRGGGPVVPWHPSSFSCPPKADIKYVNQQVFVKQ